MSGNSKEPFFISGHVPSRESAKCPLAKKEGPRKRALNKTVDVKVAC